MSIVLMLGFISLICGMCFLTFVIYSCNGRDRFMFSELIMCYLFLSVMSVALLVKYNEDQRRIGAEHKCLELGMGQYEVDVKTKEIKFRYFVNPVELRESIGGKIE